MRFPYIEGGVLDYGYAMTLHKARGLTCDRAYVLGDEHIHGEAAYTALSRGRHEDRLYAVDPEIDRESTPASTPTSSADAVRQAFEHETAKNLASQRQPFGRPKERENAVGMELKAKPMKRRHGHATYLGHAKKALQSRCAGLFG